ncbi:cobalt ECF transporter T component CbiQ [Paenibacillus allorhizosphaerae]|uniref:Cobalt ECF transporter T component CbiQ n=1 Tax=Paenibacillus allorhizosphaerae TaxID=2849866 RepID=A0ABN7TKZ9_9BACL|nr:cobalt ECF transporter T component CbiQ [Paenibacillus allorhizosphaerae]CAG7634072.1 hypothetical protein PAECIP111802_02011 [Paenibacillus allorhizosphaerae]
MIRLIDTLSYNNKLRAVSPLWKSGFAAVLFTLSYAAHPIVQMLLIGWLFVWTVGYARIPVKYVALLYGGPCLFYAASLPSLLIELRSADNISGMPPTFVLFSFAHWTAYIPEARLYMTDDLFLRIVACVSCLTFVIVTTPVSDLFQVLKKLRVPGLVLEIMLIMHRFLFLLNDTAHDLYTAQQARGGQTGLRSRLHDTAMLAVRLFGKTMQRYKALSYGLVARGFTDEIRMAPYEASAVPFRYRRESAAGILLLFALECWLRWRDIR